MQLQRLNGQSRYQSDLCIPHLDPPLSSQAALPISKPCLNPSLWKASYALCNCTRAQKCVYVPVKSSLKFLFLYFSVLFSSLSHCYCGWTIAGPVQRSILFDLKDEIVPPTNETVTQVFARLSAYRDAMDGPQVTCIHVHHSFMHAPTHDRPSGRTP